MLFRVTADPAVRRCRLSHLSSFPVNRAAATAVCGSPLEVMDLALKCHWSVSATLPRPAGDDPRVEFEPYPLAPSPTRRALLPPCLNSRDDVLGRGGHFAHRLSEPDRLDPSHVRRAARNLFGGALRQRSGFGERSRPRL